MKYTCERMFDIALVVNTMQTLREDIFEDNSEPFEPDLIHEYWVSVWADDDYVGMYRLHRITSVCWQGHAFMLREQREHSLAGGKAFCQWILENIPEAIKIIAEVPECFPNVVGFLENIGFKKQGYNSDSYSKDGVIGMHQLGMTTEEMKCQQ
jgi:hypothetical protein